jgi:hypothetical protein
MHQIEWWMVENNQAEPVVEESSRLVWDSGKLDTLQLARLTKGKVRCRWWAWSKGQQFHCSARLNNENSWRALEMSEFELAGREWPITYSLYFVRIGGDSTSAHNVTQELQSGFAKLALTKLSIELVFGQEIKY